jgi:shikimate dehydrogenase
VAVALALGGSQEVIVANRTRDRAGELCDLIGRNTGCRARVLEWPGPPGGNGHEWEAVLGRVGLVVQTTSLGMHPREGEMPPFPFELLNAGQVVVDLVYNPASTLFMDRCRRAGARVFNGLGMLLHQGAIAFEIWTGKAAPLDVMRSSLQESIYKATEAAEKRSL